MQISDIVIDIDNLLVPARWRISYSVGVLFTFCQNDHNARIFSFLNWRTQKCTIAVSVETLCAVWPDRTILERFWATNLLKKRTPTLWKSSLLWKSCFCYFLTTFGNKLGYLLFQHLVTLTRRHFIFYIQLNRQVISFLM